MSIRGSSHQDKISRGVDKGSVAKCILHVDHPVSSSHFSHRRLAVAIIKLWHVAAVHAHFLLTSQVVGISIMVGIIIFSIVIS